MRSAYCSLPGSRSSRACSGRSPPSPCQASPGCDRARSARSRRLARARASRGTRARPRRTAVDPEVRDAQRLPDGRLVRLPFLRLLEGHGRLGSTALPEMAPALLEEIVGLAHLTPQGRRCPEGQAERRPSERRRRAPATSSRADPATDRPENAAKLSARDARGSLGLVGGPESGLAECVREPAGIDPEPTVYRLAPVRRESRYAAARRADRPDSPRARRARRRRSVGIIRQVARARRPHLRSQKAANSTTAELTRIARRRTSFRSSLTTVVAGASEPGTMPVSGPRSRSRSSGDGEAPPRRLRRMSRPSAAAPPANAAVAPEASKKSDDRVLRAQPPAAGRRVERQPPVAVEPDLDPRVRIRVGDRPAALVLVEVSMVKPAATRAGIEIPEHQRHRAREVLAVAAVSGQEGDERRRAFAHRRRLVIGEVSAQAEPRLQRDLPRRTGSAGSPTTWRAWR